MLGLLPPTPLQTSHRASPQCGHAAYCDPRGTKRYTHSPPHWSSFHHAAIHSVPPPCRGRPLALCQCVGCDWGGSALLLWGPRQSVAHAMPAIRSFLPRPLWSHGCQNRLPELGRTLAPKHGNTTCSRPLKWVCAHAPGCQQYSLWRRGQNQQRCKHRQDHEYEPDGADSLVWRPLWTIRDTPTPNQR